MCKSPSAASSEHKTGFVVAKLQNSRNFFADPPRANRIAHYVIITYPHRFPLSPASRKLHKVTCQKVAKVQLFGKIRHLLKGPIDTRQTEKTPPLNSYNIQKPVGSLYDRVFTSLLVLAGHEELVISTSPHVIEPFRRGLRRFQRARLSL